MHHRIALALAAACAIAGIAPATAGAAPIDDATSGATQSMATPVADLMSSVGAPVDSLGRPNTDALNKARELAGTLPAELSGPILAAVAYFEGTGESDVQVPENGPQFTQFLWPSVAGNCIGGNSNSTGTAIAVPGPAEIPAPGAKEGEAAFVFTALGTAPAAGQQGMNVQWFNVDTMKSGTAALDNHGINPDGPATLSGTAATGRGRVVALISGDVSTQDARCSFIPTAGIFEVK